MKFLIVRFSSIGDIVLTTPLIRCLRQKFPNAEIHYLTKKNFLPVIINNPYLTSIHTIVKDFDEVIDRLKVIQFDLIIDLHNNLRTLRLKQTLREVKAVSFNKLNVEKWLLTNLKINTLPKRHIVERYMATVSSLAVTYDNKGLDYFIDDAEKVNQDDIPTSHSQGFIGIVIGAAHNTKKLPVKKLAELCEKIDHPIILLGAQEDFFNGEKIAKSNKTKIYNACGKFKLNESADLVRRSRFVISHDTGLMHIAAAYKKYIISIWGNTVPAFGMTPFETPYDVIQVNNLYCRPCSKIGYDKCPKGHFKCMNNIDINAIITLANNGLRNYSNL
ncbi:MAG: glycosyltransferase family 9 protein [Ginsengibacter sp.]